MNERLEIDPNERNEYDNKPPRRKPVTGIVLGLAAAGVAVLSWWTYEIAKPPKMPSNVPVIHSDSGPVKEVPVNPGGMVVPDQDSALLNRDSKGAPKPEQLLPAAEPVLPRPVAAPKPADTGAPSASAPPAQTATATPTPPTPSPAPSPPPAAVAPPEPAPPATAAAPKATPQATPSTPPQTAALAPATKATPGGAYRVQLGAVRSEDAAKQEWERLKKQQPDVLGKLSLTTARVDLGDKGTFYRIQAGPIADQAQAEQACAALKSRNVGCILVKP